MQNSIAGRDFAPRLRARKEQERTAARIVKGYAVACFVVAALAVIVTA